MPRRLLPALRGIEAKTLHDPAVEGKDLVITGANYSSTVRLGGPSTGTENRADGWDLGTVIVTGYEQSIWTYRCVEWISNQQSRLPFAIARNVGEPDEERLEDHPLFRVLNKRANPMETARDFRKRLSAQVLLSKRGAFVEVTRTRGGTVSRLDLLSPDRCRPIPTDDGNYIDFYEYTLRRGGIREIPPERVRWIREPHPTDPFSGTTPLEAAGLSVELDTLSRQYNVAFIHNDGRPGGIVGVDTDSMNDQEMDRVERRFTPGAQEAGKMTVIATGPGGIRYVDTTTRPRDMAYSEASKNSKLEILSAFGLDESVVSSVAGRTMDNSEQALYNAWTGTEVDHLNLIAGAFVDDVPAGYEPFVDTASVEVLEMPRRKARQEALNEFNTGVRSIDEYRPLAGLEVLDTPYARAIWITSSAKTPIPGRKEDSAALGLADSGAPLAPPSAPGEPGAAGGAAAGPPPGGATPGVAEPHAATPADGSAAHDAIDAAHTEDAAGTAAAAVDTAKDAGRIDEPGAASAAVDAARQKIEGKSLADQVETKDANRPDPVRYEPDLDDEKRLEAAIGGVLDAMFARQEGVIAARLHAPKARKGTKYWKSDGPADGRAGQQRLDTAKAVNADQWAGEASDTLAPIVTPAAGDASTKLLDALIAAGVIGGVAQGDNRSLVAAVARRTTAAAILAALTLATSALTAFLADLQAALDKAQDSSASLDGLVAALHDYFGRKARPVASSVANEVANGVLNAARTATAAALTPLPTAGESDLGDIVHTWVTKHDERVRTTHREADGQTSLIGVPFNVGGALLRYPSDPLGPAREVRNCRCHARYTAKPGARFLLPVATIGEAIDRAIPA